jgi:NTP pyrophosphatase (non-canonical NTP hydrolase)
MAQTEKESLISWLIHEALEVHDATTPDHLVDELFDVAGLVALLLRDIKKENPNLDVPSLFSAWERKQKARGRAPIDPGYIILAAQTDARGRF